MLSCIKEIVVLFSKNFRAKSELREGAKYFLGGVGETY